jgi:ribose transport system ATP-binding protein
MTGSESESASDDVNSVFAVADLHKSFPGVDALKRVYFHCRVGEIHGLVGENGAGKSTLMRILAGVIQPDSGTIRIKGRRVTLTGPRQAHDLGIAMVYQDTRLVDDLDVAQNIWLEREPGSFFFIDRRAMEQRSRALLQRLGLEIDLRRTIIELSNAERQIVEIARALTVDPAVLILDEPTSSLDPTEVERLGGILRALKSEGTGIVFISHRLPEVLGLADRITVMKDGEVVETVVNRGITEDYLVSRMVGRQLSLAFPPKQSKARTIGLEISNFSCSGRFRRVAFTVSKGEIVGLGGIQGNGQREIARALYGLLPASGEIKLNGSRIALHSPGEAIRAGIVYVPADRRAESLFAQHSIRQNIAAPHLASWSRLGVLIRSAERNAVAETINRFQVRTPSIDQPVGLLSGGNQQKVVIGRWVLGRPRLYIFEEPTQGVDVATKLELYRVIRKLADEGAMVIVISSDLLELIGISDRILVVAHGSIVDEVAAAEATEERIISSAVSSNVGCERERVAKPRTEEVEGNQNDDSPGERNLPKNTPSAKGVPDRSRPLSLGRARLAWRRYGSVTLLLALILIVSAFTSQQSPYFLTSRNLGNIFIQVVPLALVSIGQMMVILLGGIDLSVGPSMSLTTALASYLVSDNQNQLWGTAVCIGAGLLVGGINSFLILGLKIPDLISTLSTYSLVFGLALIVRPSPGGSVSESFSDFVTSRLAWVPVAGLVVLAFVLLGEYCLVRSRSGVRLYATGSRPEAAFVAGIPVRRVRCLAYLFSGLMAALAGLVIAARIGSGDPQAGTQFTLSSIAAVVVGGTSVFGGHGTMIGTLLGAALLVLLQDVLNQLHVTAYYQYIWTGALLLVAVALYSINEFRRR